MGREIALPLSGSPNEGRGRLLSGLAMGSLESMLRTPRSRGHLRLLVPVRLAVDWRSNVCSSRILSMGRDDKLLPPAAAAVGGMLDVEAPAAAAAAMVLLLHRTSSFANSVKPLPFPILINFYPTQFLPVDDYSSFTPSKSLTITNSLLHPLFMVLLDCKFASWCFSTLVTCRWAAFREVGAVRPLESWMGYLTFYSRVSDPFLLNRFLPYMSRFLGSVNIPAMFLITCTSSTP